MSENSPKPVNRAERRAKEANKRGKQPHGGQVATEIPVTSLTLIWLPELSRQLGRSRVTIERWIRERKFPPPLKITGQGCAWRVRDVEAWLHKIARQRKHTNYRGSVAAQMKRRGAEYA